MEAVTYSTFNRPPYLLQQFVGTEVQKLAGAFDSQYQAVEAAIHDLLAGLYPTGAVGNQLEVLGKIVGLSRENAPDDVYRIYLLVKAALNVNPVTPESAIRAVKAILNATEVHYTANYPAAFYLSHNGDRLPFVLFHWDVGGGTGVDLLVNEVGDYIDLTVENPEVIDALKAMAPVGVLLDVEHIPDLGEY